MKPSKETEYTLPKFDYNFSDNLAQLPVVKIVLTGIVIVAGIYLLGLTAKVISGAVVSFKDLRDSLRK